MKPFLIQLKPLTAAEETQLLNSPRTDELVHDILELCEGLSPAESIAPLEQVLTILYSRLARSRKS